MDRLFTHNFIMDVLKLPNFCFTYPLNNKNVYKLALIYLVYGFVLIFTKAEPSIIILQDVNGSEVIISSWLLPVKNGTNFSLICRIISTDGKSRKHFDNRVVWNKKRKKSSIEDLGLMEEGIPNATLRFPNVSFKDQGIYYCISFKYKLSTALNLIIRPEFPHVTPRKETITLKYPTERPKHFASTPIHSNYTREFKYTYPHMGQPAYDTDFSIFNGDYNITNEPEVLIAHTDPLLFFYVTLGFIFFITITCVAAKYRIKSNNETSATSSNCQPRNQAVANRNMCSHVVCIQNRSTHPFAECIMGTSDSRLPSSNNENLRSTHLDLPPTYDNSVGVSPSYDDDVDLLPTYDDLPPTYEDVAANLGHNSKRNLNLVCTVQTVCNDNYSLPPSYDEVLSLGTSSCGAGNSVGSRNASDC